MKVVLATGNAGKLREMRALLSPLSIDVVAQSDFNTPSAVEDGLSFVENALIKARNASLHCGLPAIADDSGLEVDALNGAPGIYSARFAGENASDEENFRKLLHDMSGVAKPQRTARFRCAMVFLRHAEHPSPIICEGTWEGRIMETADGENGFGYDPVFFVPERNCSSAQLSAAEKNALSHRGQASRKMVEILATRAETQLRE